MKQIPLLILLLLLNGCDRKLEIVQSTHENGQIQEILILEKPVSKDSIGVKQIFYKSGDIQCIGGYKGGQRHGEWTCYYPNGEIEWKSVYRNGLEDGETFCNYLDGTWKKLIIVNGVKEGKTIEYNHDTSSNQFFYVYGQYKNNKEEGLWTKTDTNNVVLIEMTFKEGKRIGYFANYYPNGRLKIKGEFNQDGQLVNFVYYDENGEKKELDTYKLFTI